MPTCKVDNQGRIVIPSSWRQAQGVTPGSSLVMLEEDGRILVMTREQALNEATAILRKYVPEGVSLSEELLRDRRRELAKESAVSIRRRK